MADYTLGTMRAAIDATAFPSGASTSTKNNLLNKVREIFYFTPEMDETDVTWKGTEIALALQVYTNPNGCRVLTLPRGVETLIGVASACGPTIIQNQWFAYLRGYSLPPFTESGFPLSGTDNVIQDMGDGFCGVVDLPTTGAQLKFTTSTTEGAGETVFISGLDANLNPISETVNLPTLSGGSVTSLLTYNTVYQIVKSVTVGNLIVNSVVSSVATFFAMYQPGETIPNYRRYIYNNNQNQNTVRAICKRRYELLVADNDPCEIGSVMAFEAGLRGYGWFQRQSMEAYRDAIKEAINYLNGELARFQSDTASATVQNVRMVSGGGMRNAY